MLMHHRFIIPVALFIIVFSLAGCSGGGSGTVSSDTGGGGGNDISIDYPTQFDFYLSPDGSNSNNGTSAETPWKTFAKAAAAMTAGKRLGLLDGTYSIAGGTGIFNFQGTGSANNFPNGLSKNAPTEICAVNPGHAIIDGTDGFENAAIWIGRSSRKDSNLKFRGLKVIGAVVFYNTDHCYVKETGIQGELGIGTNDVVNGATLTNTFNLIEDSWIWNYGSRVSCTNYQAHGTVFRRIVIRGDGGGPVSGGGHPNVGVTFYNSRNCSMQNVLVVDRLLTGGEAYADFASAQHDSGAPDQTSFYLGNNEWLGCGSINSEDSAFVFEGDHAVSGVPTWTIRNCFTDKGGFNCNPGGGYDTSNFSCAVENCTSIGAAYDA
jgi:hypothetical protein